MTPGEELGDPLLGDWPAPLAYLRGAIDAVESA